MNVTASPKTGPQTNLEGAGLTSPWLERHPERTTTFSGVAGTRKHSGIFVSSVQRSGLLPRHQDQGTTPVFGIGRLRPTSGDKAAVSTACANNRGRLKAVVATEVCLPIPMGGGFGFDPFDLGATAMKSSSDQGATPGNRPSTNVIPFPGPKPTARARPKAKSGGTKRKTNPNRSARLALLADKSHTAMRLLDGVRDLFPHGTAEAACVDMARGVLLTLFDMAYEDPRGGDHG